MLTLGQLDLGATGEEGPGHPDATIASGSHTGERTGAAGLPPRQANMPQKPETVLEVILNKPGDDASNAAARQLAGVVRATLEQNPQLCLRPAWATQPERP
jgi:hypothetical protein